ncbi:hypothetical protein [Chitinasiproducens palmae]|uniref:Uncharacterized protein n=1 Tax=Chitinasiproducens palmae TaxID=1770053 RepID=A0A1H2PLR2_9BURK|nr:hypothetical protein [Chitinasiproducens palmae]SDV47436.1 hypothetical protein SAMN05216551_1039 [Chitinasiproducens palmae]
MKALLRTLLIVDGCIALVIAAVFLLTPWLSLLPPLDAFAAQPALLGQLLGVVVAGGGAMMLVAAFNGALTGAVGKVTGHTMWIASAFALVWMIGLRVPELSTNYLVVASIAAAVVLLLGLIQVKMGSSVRWRDRLAAEGAASAERAERKALAERPVVAEPVAVPVATPVASPVAPVATTTTTTTTATPVAGAPLHETAAGTARPVVVERETVVSATPRVVRHDLDGATLSQRDRDLGRTVPEGVDPRVTRPVTAADEPVLRSPTVAPGAIDPRTTVTTTTRPVGAPVHGEPTSTTVTPSGDTLVRDEPVLTPVGTAPRRRPDEPLL